MFHEKEKNEAAPATPCCGGSVDDMRELKGACPCGTWMTRHRLGVYTAMAVFGLGFLVLNVGWLLGVIAFFRTI